MGCYMIDAFIPSKDTRAYLHSIHHEFSDLEKATIVANHYMITYEDKIGWLMDFKDRVSNEDLRERIKKAISFIKGEKESYDKGWLCDYNEALFDFVFIPHDFRHGDIVRSLYGEWDTTPYCEKIGIILGYFDKNYDFYRNMRGDYSDVQITVDTKFDGVEYQGEFSHEHINPIYIERMTLQEKDKRRPYLDYLINLPVYDEENGSIEYWIGTAKTRNNMKHALNAIIEMAEQTENNCFYFSLGKEKCALSEMVSEVHRDKLDRVHIIDTPGLCIEDVLDILDQQQMNDGRHMICVIDDVALLSTKEQGFTRIEENSVVLKKLNEYSMEKRVRFICNIAVSNYVKSKQEAIHALREYAPVGMFRGRMRFFD